MNLFGMSGICNFITSIALGVFLFRNIKGKLLIKLWALHALVAGIWGLATIFISIAPESNINVAYFWWKVAYVGLIYLPVLYYYFVCEFMGIKRKQLLKILYMLSTFFFVLNILNKDLFLGKLHYKFNQFYWTTEPGIFLWIYMAIFVFGVITLANIELIYRYLKIKERNKKIPLLYFVIGSIIGWLGGWSCYLENFDLGWYPVGNFCINLYPILLGYAIYKHKLMDIEVIVKKTLVFAGLFTFVYAVFAGMAYLSQSLFQNIVGTNRWIAMIPSVFIVIFALKPLEKILVTITNRFLFQKKYDYKELLRTFTAEVLTVLDLNNLVDLTVDKLVDIIKLDSCAVLLFDKDKQQFNVIASHNIKDPSVTLIRPDGIVTFMDETHGYILLKELAQKKISIPNSIQEIVDKLNAELVIPMVVHDDVMGVLSLGKKKSDEDYTQDDLDILLPLARTLAIAISNAELFEELSKTQAEAAQKEKMAVIGTLSAGINHEICNPLGIARGQCEAFLLNIKDGLYNNKSAEELLAKAKDIMAKVIKETDRATAITKKLSSFAKPAKGEAELVNIDKEIDEVLGLVGYELKLEKIEVEKQVERGLPNILVDKKQLQEVLFNLMRNAGQAIHEKGKITISARHSWGKVVIDIQDTGSGIPEEKIKELFNPFFTTKEPGKGTGLGLFIVRQIVEKNSGKIYLKETKVGAGTTFRLEFPAAVTQEARV